MWYLYISIVWGTVTYLIGKHAIGANPEIDTDDPQFQIVVCIFSTIVGLSWPVSIPIYIFNRFVK